MNPPPLVPAAAPGGIHLRRCARHASREAAARCPACQAYFCRECIVEHDGRLLCSTCLAKVAVGEARRRQRWTWIRESVAGMAGVIVLWLTVYWLGTLLLRIPQEFHDGTVWSRIVEREAP